MSFHSDFAFDFTNVPKVQRYQVHLQVTMEESVGKIPCESKLETQLAPKSKKKYTDPEDTHHSSLYRKGVLGCL